MRLAPMPRAASNTRSSRLRIAEAIGKTAKGMRKCVMPTMTPNSLRTSVSGSEMMPIACSQVLISPRLDSSATQPKARVSTEIQNGTRMQNSATIRCVGVPRTQTKAIA